MYTSLKIQNVIKFYEKEKRKEHKGYEGEKNSYFDDGCFCFSALLH